MKHKQTLQKHTATEIVIKAPVVTWICTEPMNYTRIFRQMPTIIQQNGYITAILLPSCKGMFFLLLGLVNALILAFLL